MIRLGRVEHAEFWAGKWADLFRLRFDTSGDKGTWGSYRWLRDSIASNKPFDQFVREVLTAEGSTDKNAAANFYRVFNTADDAAEATHALDAQLSEMMGDAPLCDTCGHITVRNGACYKCLNCGNSMGCS